MIRALAILAAAAVAGGSLGWAVRNWLPGAINDAFDFEMDAPAGPAAVNFVAKPGGAS